MASVKVRPLGDRVLVQPIEETEVKKGGIIIPDTAKEKPQEGKVVALGTGKIDDNGKKVDFTVKSGDKVLISKYGGTTISSASSDKAARKWKRNLIRKPGTQER
jgi:chaperonin GroES